MLTLLLLQKTLGVCYAILMPKHPGSDDWEVPNSPLLWIRVYSEEVGFRLIWTLNPFDLTVEGKRVDVLIKLPFLC